MLNNKTIAVVVPAYNEENQIGKVIETMPEFVDRIIVVNDFSTDKTKEIVEYYVKKYKGKGIKIQEKKGYKNKFSNDKKVEEAEAILDMREEQNMTDSEKGKIEEESNRVILINHKQNGGVGAAIASGYKWAKDHEIDCTAVMAGDGQMPPDELERICKPIVFDGVDYVKGNRLIHRSALLVIPKVRYIGNSILSILTKIASGYWHVSDTQTGYTAISLSALKSIHLHKIYKRYGVPNDLLVKLNIAMCTLKEVPIRPTYNVGESSKMKITKVIPKLSWLLVKLFFKRLYRKYLFRDFHPLFLLYHLAFIIAIFNIPLGLDILYAFITQGIIVTDQKLLIFLFLMITGFQSLLFAMWMDIQDNERLYV